MIKPFFSSVTRISDLQEHPCEYQRIDKGEWDTGDYVICEVHGRSTSSYLVELCSGRMAPVLEGDYIIGALGKRAATVDAVGSWESIDDDRMLHALTAGGLLGKMTSQSHLMSPLMKLEYRGHVLRDGKKVCMQDFVKQRVFKSLDIPIIMLIGTSMSAGKTTSGRVIIHELKAMGYKVVAAKFTGAGRYRDVLSYADAGADYIFDFVDVGLPSTVCPPDEFEQCMETLLSRIADTEADILIAELGASPLEPYNGSTAMKLLENKISMTVLSALDPYAALGIQQAFGLRVDLITGPVANTEAGIDLIEKLLDIKALNLVRRHTLPELTELLTQFLPSVGES